MADREGTTFRPPPAEVETALRLGAILQTDGSLAVPRNVPKARFMRWTGVNRVAPVAIASLSSFLQEAAGIMDTHGPSPTEVTCEVEEAYLSQSGNVHLRLRDGNSSCRALTWRDAVPEAFGEWGMPSRGTMGTATVSLQLSPAWGLRLMLSSWTPSGSGSEQKRRDALTQTMESGGMLHARSGIRVPRHLHHVAILAPDGAGLEDAEASLEALQAVGLLQLQRRVCTFEGHAAADSLEEGLRWASSTGAGAVLMVRGGGAPSSLSWLDDERILKAAAALPVALITGLGHERDHPLLELLAARAEGTPSKAALFVAGACAAPLVDARQQFQAMSNKGRRMASMARQGADGAMRRVAAASPATVLARGYAAVHDEHGRLVTAPTRGRLRVMLPGGIMEVSA